ncbi:hypothetical protein LC593_10670 [Nostoc sp. CHAB 5844]|nr:hypothetical protein [Nostoc sp. CHAB 5844]
MSTVPANYIQWNNATLGDLQPRARLYRFEELLGYVARIGNNDDYAVYCASAGWTLDAIADYGDKIPEKEAGELFPICLEAGLSYRY